MGTLLAGITASRRVVLFQFSFFICHPPTSHFCIFTRSRYSRIYSRTGISSWYRKAMLVYNSSSTWHALIPNYKLLKNSGKITSKSTFNPLTQSNAKADSACASDTAHQASNGAWTVTGRAILITLTPDLKRGHDSLYWDSDSTCCLCLYLPVQVRSRNATSQRCFSSLTCSVDQHLPHFLLVTGMYEVKHTVSSQVKLQGKRVEEIFNVDIVGMLTLFLLIFRFKIPVLSRLTYRDLSYHIHMNSL